MFDLIVSSNRALLLGYAKKLRKQIKIEICVNKCWKEGVLGHITTFTCV